jgi:hypothetical protein
LQFIQYSLFTYQVPIVKKIVIDSCVDLFGVASQLHKEGLFDMEDDMEDFEDLSFGDLSFLSNCN